MDLFIAAVAEVDAGNTAPDYANMWTMAQQGSGENQTRALE